MLNANQCAVRAAISTLVLTTLLVSNCFALEQLPSPITKILNVYKIPASAVSIVVQDVDSKVPLVSVNSDIARNPASTIKLLTTFVALATLGPTYTWRTELYALGPINDGVLNGDLLLKGYGDPSLVVEEFWKMLGDLNAHGVSSITGDLVIDDTHFSVPAIDPGAFDRFLADQTDLGTKWSPRYVRITQTLPVTHTSKVQKRQLRAQRWECDEPVYFRPARDDHLRSMTPEDATALQNEFAARGRPLAPPAATI